MSLDAIGSARLVAIAMVLGCVGEIDSSEVIDDTDVERASHRDAFACYQPGPTCEGSPNLVFSSFCREGESASYHVELQWTASEMTMGVFAPHGGKIEPHTDTIALGVATELELPYYVFVGHATDACLSKYGGPTRSNHRALHITSTHLQRHARRGARTQRRSRAVDPWPRRAEQAMRRRPHAATALGVHELLREVRRAVLGEPRRCRRRAAGSGLRSHRGTRTASAARSWFAASTSRR